MPVPRNRDSVHVRPIFEVIEMTCWEGHHDHEECLLVLGAKWPEPSPTMDLEAAWWAGDD